MNLIQNVFEAGVVGAGGAGFPTHVKLDAKAEYLIINAAECEPLLETDKYMMRNMAERIVRGACLAGQHLQAEHIIIALKKAYHSEAEKLTQAIKAQCAPVTLSLMDSFYPAGDEHVMANHVTGRVVPPGGVPIQAGMVVSNVGTMIGVADAADGIAVSRKLVSVLGEVHTPRLVDVPVGAPLSACIEAAGGLKRQDVMFVLGGPMMGRCLSPEQCEQTFVTKTTGAIIAIPADLSFIKRKEQPLQHILNRAKSVCIQCAYCTEMCPRYLLGHDLRPHKMMRLTAYQGFDQAVQTKEAQEALLCSECGVCEEYACPMGLSPRRVNVAIKAKLRERGVKYTPGSLPVQARAGGDGRRIPSHRLIARLGLDKYHVSLGDHVVVPDVTAVRVPLRQHIGQAAVPVVKEGDSVCAGEKIGQIPTGAMGANVHTGISGTVIKIDEYVWIEKEVVS